MECREESRRGTQVRAQNQVRFPEFVRPQLNVGLRPTPRLGRLRGPDAPRRSLAGALCAPPLCGNENRILVRSRITVQARIGGPMKKFIAGLTMLVAIAGSGAGTRASFAQGGATPPWSLPQ